MTNTLTLRVVPRSEDAGFDECKRDLGMLISFMQDPKVLVIWNTESHRELMGWCEEMKRRYKLK